MRVKVTPSMMSWFPSSLSKYLIANSNDISLLLPSPGPDVIVSFSIIWFNTYGFIGALWKKWQKGGFLKYILSVYHSIFFRVWSLIYLKSDKLAKSKFMILIARTFKYIWIWAFYSVRGLISRLHNVALILQNHPVSPIFPILQHNLRTYRE